MTPRSPSRTARDRTGRTGRRPVPNTGAPLRCSNRTSKVIPYAPTLLHPSCRELRPRGGRRRERARAEGGRTGLCVCRARRGADALKTSPARHRRTPRERRSRTQTTLHSLHRTDRRRLRGVPAGRCTTPGSTRHAVLCGDTGGRVPTGPKLRDAKGRACRVRSDLSRQRSWNGERALERACRA